LELSGGLSRRLNKRFQIRIPIKGLFDAETVGSIIRGVIKFF